LRAKSGEMRSISVHVSNRYIKRLEIEDNI